MRQRWIDRDSDASTARCASTRRNDIAVPTTAPAPTTTLPPPTTPTPATASQTAPTSITAVDAAQAPKIDAAAYVVYDVDTQQWLADSEADTQRPVGSLMKLLTAYVVMQAGDPTHVATVPPMDLDPAESAIGLYEGQRLPRDDPVRAS